MFSDEPVYVNYQTIDEYVREASYVDGAEYNISGNNIYSPKSIFACWLSNVVVMVSSMSQKWF